MKIACTGFVSEQAGSVAAANALLLRALLAGGIQIEFFSKPTFVDPRPTVGELPGFRFVPVINRWSDEFRRKVQRVPVLATLAGRQDAVSYNWLLVQCIRREHHAHPYDAVLWLGDYAHGTVPGIPTISFVQGPPGTDARSVLRCRGEIRRLAGWRVALRWELLARLRLSQLGLPQMKHSNHFIVGSSESAGTLAAVYGIPPQAISKMPYPIDLDLFNIPTSDFRAPTRKTLRILWLGRIVPRKRLDVFLGGLALALSRGVSIEATVVGRVGFVSGYEKLLREFSRLDCLSWIPSVSRRGVPSLMHRHDVLAQPSDHEDFGSSVAEAQACGLPVIVGQTNGNADYLCTRDIHLQDDLPETLSAALQEMAARKADGRLGSSSESRKFAERTFAVSEVSSKLLTILEGRISNALYV